MTLVGCRSNASLAAAGDTESAAAVANGAAQNKDFANTSGLLDKLQAVAGKCTHMGCELKWNGAETSWDCECHGSRFAPDGRVLEGPALAPLQAAKVGTGA